MSDIDTVVVDSLKALDPEWPIREADIASRQRALPLCANRVLMQRSKQPVLFDHLVGAREQRRREDAAVRPSNHLMHAAAKRQRHQLDGCFELSTARSASGRGVNVCATSRA